MTSAPDRPTDAPNAPKSAKSSPSWRDVLTVYLQRRVLVVLMLGFSAGLPLSLTGQTLQAWMTESGVDIKTIGLFAFVGTPYWTKVFWSPAVDALDVPILTKWLGRRRAWLVITQLMLGAAIVLLASCNPKTAPFVIAIEPLVADIGNQENRWFVPAARMKGMRLPRVDGDSGTFVDQVRNVANRHHCGRAAEMEGQMALAMGVGAHRLVELVDGHAAERPVTDRQSGAHRLTPKTLLPGRTSLFCLRD